MNVLEMFYFVTVDCEVRERIHIVIRTFFVFQKLNILDQRLLLSACWGLRITRLN